MKQRVKRKLFLPQNLKRVKLMGSKWRKVVQNQLDSEPKFISHFGSTNTIFVECRLYYELITVSGLINPIYTLYSTSPSFLGLNYY